MPSVMVWFVLTIASEGKHCLNGPWLCVQSTSASMIMFINTWLLQWFMLSIANTCWSEAYWQWVETQYCTHWAGENSYLIQKPASQYAARGRFLCFGKAKLLMVCVDPPPGISGAAFLALSRLSELWEPHFTRICMLWLRHPFWEQLARFWVCNNVSLATHIVCLVHLGSLVGHGSLMKTNI